ncbi:ATP-binding cassette domain-containing protein [Streptomyces sp. NPDC002809]|uniref:ABC transporter ATP-binding protein n=1 Tax=Streptomyces sp. NPDC002809 TaxID=3154433 RepID=UPI00332C9D51
MSLQYQSCTFRYRRRSRPVLDQLNLTFSDGHTVLLGPNGAGKSTLLALGASATTPQAGVISYQGINPARRRDTSSYRRKVSWLPQRPEFLSGMTCREHVAYTGWLKGMTEREAWNAAAAAVDRVGLTDKLDHRIKTLSGGQRQRVAIAQALVHSAEILLLDEPTVGLDPKQRRTFIDLLASLRGTISVIVSTHDIADIDQAYDEVVVLESGRPRFTGSVEAFASHARHDAVEGRRLESAYSSLLEGVE